MERGEVQAIAGLALFSVKTEYATAIRSREFSVVAAYGLKSHPELIDVPLFPLGETEETRQIFTLLYSRQLYGIPFAMPPGVLPDRIQAIQHALEDTFRDPALLAEAKNASIDINQVPASDLTALTTQLFKTPQSVVAHMQEIPRSSSK